MVWPCYVQCLGDFYRSAFVSPQLKTDTKTGKKEMDGLGAIKKGHQEILPPDTLLSQPAGMFNISNSK